MKESKNSLSVLIITKNSEELLTRCLDSVQFVDEIVIIDDHSTDKTVEIAKQKGAKVITHSFVGFGQQKRFGLTKVTGMWALILDVDEVLSSPLQKEVQNILKIDSKYNGYRIPYQNHFLDHPLKTLEQYGKVRLFKKDKGTVTNVAVHEETQVQPPIGELSGKIMHYSYRTIPQVIKKFTKYAMVEGEILAKNNESVTWRNVLSNPIHMFWAIFVGDKGYKDGVWGFGLGLCFAYYEFRRILLQMSP